MEIVNNFENNIKVTFSKVKDPIDIINWILKCKGKYYQQTGRITKCSHNSRIEGNTKSNLTPLFLNCEAGSTGCPTTL